MESTMHPGFRRSVLTGKARARKYIEGLPNAQAGNWTTSRYPISGTFRGAVEVTYLDGTPVICIEYEAKRATVYRLDTE